MVEHLLASVKLSSNPTAVPTPPKKLILFVFVLECSRSIQKKPG
jgi:hypothetical protein